MEKIQQLYSPQYSYTMDKVQQLYSPNYVYTMNKVQRLKSPKYTMFKIQLLHRTTHTSNRHSQNHAQFSSGRHMQKQTFPSLHSKFISLQNPHIKRCQKQKWLLSILLHGVIFSSGILVWTLTLRQILRHLCMAWGLHEKLQALRYCNMQCPMFLEKKITLKYSGSRR